MLTSDSDKQQSADGVLKSIFQATTALQGNTAALQRFSPTQKSFVLWHEPGAQALERPQVRQAFDYTITYTLTSSVPLPYACDWTDRIMAMPPKIPVNDRKLVAAFLSAHCEVRVCLYIYNYYMWECVCVRHGCACDECVA